MQPAHEEVETARGGLEAAVDGVGCGEVSGSVEGEPPVVEDVEAYVAAQLSDGESYQLHLKQWEAEMLTAKLLKVVTHVGRVDTCGVYLINMAPSLCVLQKWTAAHPEAGQDEG